MSHHDVQFMCIVNCMALLLAIFLGAFVHVPFPSMGLKGSQPLEIKQQHGTPEASLSSSLAANKPVFLSKAAVDELIHQAADAKYIKDVLRSSELRLPKHHLALQAPSSIHSSQSFGIRKKITRLNSNLNCCSYNGQSYVDGDLVKTEAGWMRCSTQWNHDGIERLGKSKWIVVQ